MSVAGDRDVRVPGTTGGAGPVTLAVRVHAVPAATGSALLVHGLASNARMWDACAEALASAQVSCAAVDLRGHGRSAALGGDGPFDTTTAAADVSALVEQLRADGTLPGPLVLAGQSWGGNVVLTAAAGTAGAAPARVDALALVDGGWLRFDRGEPFEQLWQRLAPPRWGGVTWAQLGERLGSGLGAWGPHALPAVLGNLTSRADGTVRNILSMAAHEQILRSIYEADPRELYPHVAVPTLLVPAGGGGGSERVDEAASLLPRARVERYEGAHHDLHLQHPRRLAADLAGLLAQTTGTAGPAGPTAAPTSPAAEDLT